MTRRRLSPTKRARLFMDWNGVCYRCDRPIKRGEAWDIDHKTPLALGGADDEHNLAPMHIDCHGKKTAVDIRQIRKADRQCKAHAGINRKSRPIAGSKASGWKHAMNGEWSRR